MRKYCYVFFVTHKYFVMVDAEGGDVNEVKERRCTSRNRTSTRWIPRASCC